MVSVQPLTVSPVDIMNPVAPPTVYEPPVWRAVTPPLDDPLPPTTTLADVERVEPDVADTVSLSSKSAQSNGVVYVPTTPHAWSAGVSG